MQAFLAKISLRESRQKDVFRLTLKPLRLLKANILFWSICIQALSCARADHFACSDFNIMVGQYFLHTMLLAFAGMPEREVSTEGEPR